jgi:hypothetical protein
VRKSVHFVIVLLVSAFSWRALVADAMEIRKHQMHSPPHPGKRDGHQVRRASVLCGPHTNTLSALFKKEQLLGKACGNVRCTDHNNEL